MSHSAQMQIADRQRGFSLIEFMVAATISMAVVLAASSVYLSSSQTQRALGEKAMMFEGARVTMDLIGRDLENAGYYPADNSPGTNRSVKVVGYQNPCINPVPTGSTVRLCGFANPTPFNFGVFGCTNQRLVRSGTGASVSYACAAHPTGVGSTVADSLVVNYYTIDSAGLNVGQRSDCENQDVANDTINSRNKTAPTASPLANPNRLTYDQAWPASLNSSTVPQLPLFVSNRYSLTPVNSSTATAGQKFQVDRRLINTLNLACNGNGNDNDDNSSSASNASPMVPGLDQMKFSYLVRTAGTGEAQYMTASSVPDWGRVVAVRVCLLARSFQSVQNASYTMTDCLGTSSTFTDGFSRKVFTQVFVLKNVMLN